MKLMEISPEVEKALIAIMDSALKAAGLSLINHAQTVLAAIKEKADQPQG